MAQTPEATILRLRQAACSEQQRLLLLSWWLKLSGCEASSKRVMSHLPGQSCQAQAGWFTYYFAFICMALYGRGPHSSATASPTLAEFCGFFSLNTPFSSKEEPLSRTAGGMKSVQEVVDRRCFLWSTLSSPLSCCPSCPGH